ncbi:hypothetical protein [Bacillus phage CM1]|nr:hypothetical protein [Bacillus phage CM1]
MPYVIVKEYCPHCKSEQDVKNGFVATCLNCRNVLRDMWDDEEDENNE